MGTVRHLQVQHTIAKCLLSFSPFFFFLDAPSTASFQRPFGFLHALITEKHTDFFEAITPWVFLEACFLLLEYELVQSNSSKAS